MPCASITIRFEDDLVVVDGEEAGHQRGRDMAKRDELHAQDLVFYLVTRNRTDKAHPAFTRYDHVFGLRRQRSLCSQPF